jgi:hypothetical protein
VRCRCGEPVEDGDTFCTRCGYSIAAAPGAQAGVTLLGAGRVVGAAPMPASGERRRLNVAVVSIVVVLAIALVSVALVLGFGGGAKTGVHQSRSAPRHLAGSVPSSTAAPSVPQWEEVGRSVEGRPLRLMKVGDGPRHVLFVGGIHGTEPQGAVAAAQLGQAFLDAGLGGSTTLWIVEDLNPDGRAAGSRYNARGIDLNRNFPASNYVANDQVNHSGPEATSEPETRVLVQLLQQVMPTLVIVCHADIPGSGSDLPPYVNFDGPGLADAEAFAQLSGWPIVRSDRLPSTPGSLGSYVGVDGGTAILTLEFSRDSAADDDWVASRSAILGVIGG